MSTDNDRAILNSIFNPLLPIGDCLFEEDIPIELRDEEEQTLVVQEAKQFELEGVEAAEKGETDRAINLFTKAVLTAPERASGYNNRAQALRLQGKITEALVDLNNAINLSEGKGNAACQAFCQRALIHQKQGNEEDARLDFAAAAKLGSSFAKAQVVLLNPYAALCNKMLADVIGALQRGECMEKN